MIDSQTLNPLAGTSTPTQSQSSPAKGAASQGDSAVQTFLDYMKETPAQRFEDEWLAAHHLTSKELAKMPAKQREAIIKQMESDIKARLQQDVGIGASSGPATGAGPGAAGASS